MNLFLVPASSENIKETIVKAIDISIARRFMNPSEFKELKKLLGSKSQFNCWAMTESSRAKFEKMGRGDVVLITVKATGLFKYYGEVFYATESVKMGNYLWPFTPNKPWKLIYFLKNLQEINIDKSKLMSRGK